MAKKLAEHLVTAYDGPEITVECVKVVDLGLLGKHCVEWKAKLKRHAYYMEMWGPDDMDAGQALQIKDACLASAVSGAIVGLVFTPGGIVGQLAGARAAAEVALHACIQTTRLLGRFVVSDFNLKICEKHYWPGFYMVQETNTPDPWVDTNTEESIQSPEMPARPGPKGDTSLKPHNPPPPNDAPDWQKHCWWCSVDPGSSGSTFREALKEGRSGYWAAIDCQTDAQDQAAVNEITAAGEDAVNAYVATL